MSVTLVFKNGEERIFTKIISVDYTDRLVILKNYIDNIHIINIDELAYLDSAEG